MIETTIARRNLLKLSAALAVAGCAPRTAGLGTGPASFDWTLRPPEEAGMSRAGIEGIRTALQKLVDEGAIQGMVSAVARRNKLVWYEAQGWRNPLTQTPMPRDGIFRMMSSTKPIAAVAALMMIDEGRLSLDDKVSRFLPGFKDMKVAVAPPGVKDAAQVKLEPLAREITVRHLMTHSSGITNIGNGALPGGAATPAALVNKVTRTPDDTLATYLPKLGGAALEFQPGTKFEYSPLEGPDILLRIVEMLSGQPIDVFLRERLFEPLDMRDTYFNVPAEKQSRIIEIFGKNGAGKWEERAHLLGPGPYKYLSGGAGLFSTVHDYLNFELMLLNKGSFNGRRILKAETVRAMATNEVGELFRQWMPRISRGNDFGLMVRIARDADNADLRTVGSFGWGGAYGTDSWVEPELELAAVFFIQIMWLPPEAPIAFEKAIRGAIVA